MNPLHRFALLLALLGSAAVAGDGFRIMDEAEMARHKAQLDTLQGQAREDYRNQVWQALRQRARTRLPDAREPALDRAPARPGGAGRTCPPRRSRRRPPPPGAVQQTAHRQRPRPQYSNGWRSTGG